MTRIPGWNRQPDHYGALAAYQREADKQAARWIEQEIIGLMRGRVPFDGHEPVIGYNKRTNDPLLVHTSVTVRRLDIQPEGRR